MKFDKNVAQETLLKNKIKKEGGEEEKEKGVIFNQFSIYIKERIKNCNVNVFFTLLSHI